MIPRLMFMALCLGLWQCQQAPHPIPVAKLGDSSAAPQPSKADTTAVEDSLITVHLVFVGDIMSHSNQIKAAYDDSLKLYDFSSWFSYIAPRLQAADWSFGNLELTLNGRGEYTGYPRFRSPTALGGYLKAAGFKVIVTANNHSNDGDLYGLLHTLDVLDSLGLPRTGTFRDSAERAAQYPLILEKTIEGQPFRIALLNFSYGTNGLPTKKPSIVNLMDTVQIKKDLAKARAAGVDLIIAMPHWGNEYELKENKYQRQMAEMLWREGVDLVVGSHPHVVQPVKVDTVWDAERKRQRPVLTAYSLGNYIHNQEQPNTEVGLLLEVYVEKDLRTGQTRLKALHHEPLWRQIYKPSAKVVDWVYTAIPLALIAQDTANALKLSEADRKKALKERKYMTYPKEYSR